MECCQACRQPSEASTLCHINVTSDLQTRWELSQAHTADNINQLPHDAMDTAIRIRDMTQTVLFFLPALAPENVRQEETKLVI